MAGVKSVIGVKSSVGTKAKAGSRGVTASSSHTTSAFMGHGVGSKGFEGQRMSAGVAPGSKGARGSRCVTSMAAKISGYIKLALTAGKANPAPPVGPALGSKGVNIMMFCKEYNARTQDQAGMVIPVEITVYEDKSFTFILKTPPASILLAKAAGVKGGAPTSAKGKVGTITKEQLMEIATIKMPDLNAAKLESAARIVAGTAANMGIKIEGWDMEESKSAWRTEKAAGYGMDANEFKKA